MVLSFILLMICGTLCGFIDSSLGMGYGVTAASVLVSFGIGPAIASASIHTAEAVVDTVSSGSHIKLGNIRKDLLIPLIAFGSAGAVLGALGLTSLSTTIARPIISAVLLVLGLLILYKYVYRWKKGNDTPAEGKKNYSRKILILLGFLAGFVDAAGGGGWGPILTSTFVATGSSPRKAVGTVEVSEPIISVAAFVTFGILIGFESFLWSLVIPILIGGIILTPVAAYVTARMPRRWLGILVGLWIAALNIRTLFMTFV